MKHKTGRVCKVRDGKWSLGWYEGLSYHAEYFDFRRQAIKRARDLQFTHLFIQFSDNARKIA